jgi:hypothetical protein
MHGSNQGGGSTELGNSIQSIFPPFLFGLLQLFPNCTTFTCPHTHALTHKDLDGWPWGPTEQHAFDTLKHLITSNPVLQQPQLDKQFKLEVDASGFAIGVVLLQKDKTGKRLLMGFFSRSLNEAEHNYDIYDLEFVALTNGLEYFRTYLIRSPHKVIVYTDHMNLQYWREPHKIS